MPMKVSDYIAQFLVRNGVHHLFFTVGEGKMPLLDSVESQENLECIHNLNEQASGICAESYGQFTNYLGACLLTSGTEVANAITGCAGAWLDSTPALYISGQTENSQSNQSSKIRQNQTFGTVIIPMVKPITKYAATLTNKDDTRYHLEKAVYLATHGRRGPVWIDVPFDIQGAEVDANDLRAFCPSDEGLEDKYPDCSEDVSDIISLLNNSKRPALLLGHGVVGAGTSEQIKAFAKEYRIPVLVTWRAKGIFGDEEELFMGSPGIPATRFSNYVLQNSDFLLILGTRLNPAITAYKEECFAPNAKKVIVDIEEKEISKLSISFEKTLCTDLRCFMSALDKQKAKILYKRRESWHSYCKNVKEKYPLSKEVQPFEDQTKVDGYLFANKLSQFSEVNDVFIGSPSGRTCPISYMAYNLKANQKFINSMGIGSMGWCIPSAIASCVASGRHRTLVMEGDGSLQHNIQELALINTYKLPLKIFIWSNEGYSQIYAMQKNNFCSRYAGCNIESGLGLPKVIDTAIAYGLNYYLIRDNGDIDEVLEKAMCDDSPVICEVCGSIEFDEIPKSMTILHPDGTFTSSDLTNLYPFLSDEEIAENMPCWDD